MDDRAPPSRRSLAALQVGAFAALVYYLPLFFFALFSGRPKPLALAAGAAAGAHAAFASLFLGRTPCPACLTVHALGVALFALALAAGLADRRVLAVEVVLSFAVVRWGILPFLLGTH